MRLSELASILEAKMILPEGFSDEDVVIQKIAPIEKAVEGDVTFVSNPEYAKYARTTKASAVIVKDHVDDCPKPQLIHRNPYLAFAKTAQVFFRPARGPSGVSDNAFIASDAELGDDVTVYPFVFVGSRAKIGDNVILHPGVFVGDDVVIGDNTIVYANAAIYHDCKIGQHVIIHAGSVIGADGFGYAVGEGEIVKIPQVGHVEIGDHVELGASCSVDRAAMGVTRIGNGTKLDNRVQVGHNCQVGENCMLSAFVGLAGSSTLGDWVVMGGHSGVNGHIEVGTGVRLGGMSGIIKSTDKPGEYIGFPAQPAGAWRRQQVHLKRLADYEKRIKALEKALIQSESK